MFDDLILVAASDDVLAADLARRLEIDGYCAHTATAERQLMLLLGTRAPTALLLADMPDLVHSLAIVRALRAMRATAAGVDASMPVVVLSSAVGELCELSALDAGADEFQAVDCPPAVLRARLARILARCRATHTPERLRIGELLIDLSGRTAQYAGQAVSLSRKEFDLLARLGREPTRVVAPEELLRDVWGWHAPTRTRTVATCASRLRARLAAAGAQGFVAPSRGAGYRLAPFHLVA